jgi:hypothetical protein
MPTYEHTTKEAVNNLANNSASRWFKTGIDPDDQDGPFAVQRMKQPLFTPSIPDPGFRFSSQDGIFAMGSCFARGIENALLGKGFRVVSAATEFDDFELAQENVTGRGFMNKYSTHALRHELEWALDPNKRFPEESLVDLGDGTWVDPSANPTLKWVNFGQSVQRHETISRVVARIADCRVAVLTLGLVELWFDHKTGIYLNMAPSPQMQQLHPDRYSFQVSGFEENRANMEAIGNLLTACGQNDLQIVVTTSPVPLMATFTNRDVVVANSYSKSILRAVAEDFASSRVNAHYFPSYEIVLNSDQGIAWTEDGRHVQPEVVHHIMALFQQHFVLV